MSKIKTQDEVVTLCRRAGFNATNAKIASAIAMCESAYSYGTSQYANFGAIGDQDLADDVWGFSYGGFQIRSLRSQKGTGGYRDEDRLLEPLFNAKSALHIKKTQGWRAWSVYTSGMYKAYLQDLYPPPANTYVVLAGDTISGIANKFGLVWTDLARWNNLHFPYTIFIGQILLLKDPISV